MYRVIRYKPLSRHDVYAEVSVCVSWKNHPPTHIRAAKSPVVCVPQTKGFQANYVWLILSLPLGEHHGLVVFTPFVPTQHICVGNKP